MLTVLLLLVPRTANRLGLIRLTVNDTLLVRLGLPRSGIENLALVCPRAKFRVPVVALKSTPAFAVPATVENWTVAGPSGPVRVTLSVTEVAPSWTLADCVDANCRTGERTCQPMSLSAT